MEIEVGDVVKSEGLNLEGEVVDLKPGCHYEEEDCKEPTLLVQHKDDQVPNYWHLSSFELIRKKDRDE